MEEARKTTLASDTHPHSYQSQKVTQPSHLLQTILDSSHLGESFGESKSDSESHILCHLLSHQVGLAFGGSGPHTYHVLAQ